MWNLNGIPSTSLAFRIGEIEHTQYHTKISTIGKNEFEIFIHKIKIKINLCK